MSWPLVEPVAPAVLPVAVLPLAVLPVADDPVADPAGADPVVDPELPDILLSSVPRTSTWLFAYFCRSDWLPSSLMRAIAADELGELEPDAVLPVEPEPLLAVPEPLPILAFIRTNALPALAAPAPVVPVPLELEPVVPLAPEARVASALCRHPVNVTCRLDCESWLPVCGGVVCALTPTAITAENTEPSTILLFIPDSYVDVELLATRWLSATHIPVAVVILRRSPRHGSRPQRRHP